MDIKLLIKNMIRDFFVIYSGCILATLFFCMIFDPTAQFDLKYFAQMILVTICGDLPLFVFYSKRDLTEKEWKMRLIFHFVIVFIIVMIFGKVFDLYKNIIQACIFAMTEWLIYIAVFLIGHYNNMREAEKINRKIKELKNRR